MKNTKNFLFSAGVALALFSSTHISAMDPAIAGMVPKHEAEIQKIKVDIEILKRTVERLVAAEKPLTKR